MWRARNAFMLLSLIVALWSAAVAQPGVTPGHRPTPPDSDEQRIADLVVASRILVQEGVLDSFGHVTVRSLNNPNHYFMPRAMPPALVTANDIVELNLDSVSIDANAPRTNGERCWRSSQQLGIETPAAANTRVKALRAIFRWAVEAEEAAHDPTRDVRLIRYTEKGYHSWSLDEVSAYEERHPVGTKARLAMALLLYTTGRREDAVRLGPQHARDGRIQYRQAKNEHRSPVDLDIPLHDDLKAIIDATPSSHLTFLVTEYGRPFTPAGFGNLFKDWCRQANLPHCSAHGLRKATAARLAERGATAHEIMAITGHKSLEEVERYTRAARQAKLADAAMAKLK